VLHRACTALTLKLLAQKLVSGVVLDWFLISSCPEPSCSAPAWLSIDAASQHEACAAVLCLSWDAVPWTSLCTSWQDFPDPPGFDAHKQVRYNTPRGSSLVQSRRANSLSVRTFPCAKQVVLKLPCEMWFYMVPTDTAIMDERGCNVRVIPQASQGKCKDLE